MRAFKEMQHYIKQNQQFVTQSEMKLVTARVSEIAMYARNAELYIENIHAHVHEQNYLLLDDLKGESVFNNYLQCIKVCCRYEFSTMVIHLPNDSYPLNEFGMQRLKTIIDMAESKDIYKNCICRIMAEHIININYHLMER